MKAVIYVLPYVTKPAFEAMEPDFLEAGYTDMKTMKMGCKGKYTPPVFLRRVS